MAGVILEVCVDSAESLQAAVAGGADRIELCSALALGGLTPSAGFLRQAVGCGVPVLVMIRPRAGDFIWSGADIAVMQADIAAVRAAGLAGVVLGASLPDGRLDVAALGLLVTAAKGMSLTLHRCFDLVPDPFVALEQAVDLGFHRILTSGGAAPAVAGIDRLVALQGRAAGRIVILPGGGITADTVAGLAPLAPTELHGSCAVARPMDAAVAAFGFGPAVARVTDAALVRALRLAAARADR